MKRPVKVDLARERALEAQRVVEAWEAVEERTGLEADQARDHGSALDQGRAIIRHAWAVEQLQAAQDHANACRVQWTARRPGGGRRGPTRTI